MHETSHPLKTNKREGNEAYLLDDNIAFVLRAENLEHLCIHSFLDISAVGPLEAGDVLGATKEHSKELVAVLDQSVLDRLSVCIDSLLNIVLGHNDAYQRRCKKRLGYIPPFIFAMPQRG